MSAPPELISVVWFKRDLRIADHAPLREAAKRGATLPLFIDEPSLFTAPDQAPQHVHFREECLRDLGRDLARLGATLLRARGEAVEVFEALHRACPFTHIFSHEETGNLLTYARDRAVQAWCRARGVTWNEHPQNGVIRRLNDRDGWARLWEQRMGQATLAAPTRTAHPSSALPTRLLAPQPEDSLPLALSMPAGSDKPLRQRGGLSPAREALRSFLDGRGQAYSRGMSSPLSAEEACSRLSPYLAFGVLSMRQVHHALVRRMAELRAAPAGTPQRALLTSLRAFEGRLHWHCHFMQKLESEPRIERENVHRGFDGLRESDFDEARFTAWKQGATGFPLVDACMRMLAQTGWINFRMRAMLVSVASYHLWLHWREPALWLAREFLDYEPGIHYPQVQMQSGVTGINTLRIYNPVKQAHDQDPDGTFVRRWVPELADLASPYIFEPHSTPPIIAADLGIGAGAYPAPLVDAVEASRAARERITQRRRLLEVREESRQVLERHGSRKRTARSSQGRRVSTRTPSAAEQLFFPEDDTE